MDFRTAFRDRGSTSSSPVRESWSRLTFRHGSSAAPSLADLLRQIPRPQFLSSTLSALCLSLPPLDVGDTVFRGVRCCVDSDPRFTSPPVPPSTRAEAREAIRDVVERSVARAMGSSRRVAVLAGGGLDSSVVLAVAKKIGDRHNIDVFAVALDFEGPGDDRPYLRLLERQVGCRVIRVAPEDSARHIDAIRGVDRAPFTYANAFGVVEMMRRAREEGADVVLTGSGGDDVFDGDPRAISNFLRRSKPLVALRMAATLRGFARPSSPVIQWALRPLVARYVPRSLRVARQRRAPLRWWGAPLPAWAGPEMVRYLEARRSRNAERLARALDADRGTLSRLEGAILANLVTYESWRGSRLAGIPRVDPLEDPEVASVVSAIPLEWLLGSGLRRGLFRETFRDLIPAALADRTDKAFFEPSFIRMLDAAGGLSKLEHLVDVRRLAEMGIVRPTQFRQAFTEHSRHQERGGFWSTVWPTLATEAFLREEEQR